MVEGNCGYVRTKLGIQSVVIGKISRGKAKLFVVSTNLMLSLSEEQFSVHLKDEKADLK